MDRPNGRTNIEADVRERIIADHSKQFAACHDLVETVDGWFPWKGRHIDPPKFGVVSADQIILMEFSRGTKSFQASISLAETGYGEQAAMLNRSLLEGALVAHWVHEAEVDAEKRFAQGIKLDDHLSLERLKNVGWIAADQELNEPLSAEELEALKKMFGRYGELLWTGHKDVRKLFEAVEHQWSNEESRKGMWSYIRVAHQDNNAVLHSTVSGLSRAVTPRTTPSEFGVWSGPSSLMVDNALLGAWLTFTQLTTLMVDRFKIPDGEALHQMVEEKAFDFRKIDPEELKNIGRNDRCPCGSGKKFKKCHGR